MSTTEQPTDPKQAAAIAAEEITGLALQERGLTALLARQAAETPQGPARERVERHLEQSREHQQVFDAQMSALDAHRGPGEYVAGIFRSGLAAIGSVGATVGQVATAPLAVLRQGGAEERLLENAGVEGAALANKLVILTAVSAALERSGEDASHQELVRVRDEACGTWDELLEQTPELMAALVTARSRPS